MVKVCAPCFGRGWTLPKPVTDLLSTLDGDVRLDTVTDGLMRYVPLDTPSDLLDRLLWLIELIQQEVGDAWSPTE